MSSTARIERRHLWWKQHKNQIEDNGDGAVEEAKKHRKKYSHKETTKEVEKEQPTTPTENNNKKTRFILFVGNLPFDLQKDDIIHHFRCTGGVVDFRLMTKKDSGSSKGCGFLELDSFASYEKALNLHHSLIGKRKINVEVTCGGGGTGEKRSEKLNEKKKKFRQRRGKKSKSGTENKDDVNGEGKQQSLSKKNKPKTNTADEKLSNKSETTEDMTKVKKAKKRKTTTVDDDSSNEKPKKKSLKQSDIMNSLVKDLGLETLVKEKRVADSEKVEKKLKKAKKRAATEDFTSNEQTNETSLTGNQERNLEMEKAKKAKKRKTLVNDESTEQS